MAMIDSEKKCQGHFPRPANRLLSRMFVANEFAGARRRPLTGD
jgi:hypothetical protein